MNERYIVLSTDKYGGHWGSGNTLKEAEANHRKAGGKKKDIQRIEQFKSEKPFAPSTRDANEDEADAYCAQDGSLNWIRCERNTITV